MSSWSMLSCAGEGGGSRYIVYAIDRKKSQDNARKGVGKDTVSAINLMVPRIPKIRCHREAFDVDDGASVSISLAPATAIQRV